MPHSIQNILFINQRLKILDLCKLDSDLTCLSSVGKRLRLVVHWILFFQWKIEFWERELRDKTTILYCKFCGVNETCGERRKGGPSMNSFDYWKKVTLFVIYLSGTASHGRWTASQSFKISKSRKLFIASERANPYFRALFTPEK
jgi:hypothetical protein